MTTYLDEVLSNVVSPPQSQPLDSDQVENSAGGFSYVADEFSQLRRFLILGSEGGSYYAGQKELTVKNIKAVERCLKIDGIKTVDEIVSVSVNGRAPKNDQALLALALCVAYGDDRTKAYALSHLNSVARIGTHLFQIVEFLNKLGCLTGRAKRRAIARWYTSKSPDKLAYQLVKYRNRAGWTHPDVLRVSHPGSIEPVDAAHKELFKWMVSKSAIDTIPDIDVIAGFTFAQNSDSPERTAELVKEYKLPREALKTEHLSEPLVWQALLDAGMPVTALIRNLGNMTRLGLFDNFKNFDAVEKALSPESLVNGRVHPLTILFALSTYKSGSGFRGGNSWKPVSRIVDALDGAFYDAFGAVEPTGKRYLLALDVSGSMGWGTVGGTNLTPRDASAAMALVTAAVEKNVEIVAFSDGRSNGDPWGYNWRANAKLTNLDISPKERLGTAIRKVSGLPFGGTDCALPMIHAREKGLEIDTFVVYTDSETWFGKTHPAKALKDYRKASGINSKLVVVGMVANEFTIADPKDNGMLDVVGFDTATPNIISEFSLGHI